MIREILKELMTKRCVAMTRESARCYKTGKCDGQCADFFAAANEIEEHEEMVCNMDD